jgi:hypothetical protein
VWLRAAAAEPGGAAAGCRQLSRHHQRQAGQGHLRQSPRGVLVSFTTVPPAVVHAASSMPASMTGAVSVPREMDANTV